MNPIIHHLANLKFYSRFKKSPAKNFDQYVEFIDSGSPEEFNWLEVEDSKVIEEYKFDDPFLGDILDSETEDEVLKFLEQERLKENTPAFNLDDWYFNTEKEIIFRLKQYHVRIDKKKNPYTILENLIKEYKLIRDLIRINNEDFYNYTSRMQAKAPEDFLKVFSVEKNIEDYPLIDCYPRVFRNCKSYAFFEDLRKKVENHTADYSYIFYQMRYDKLIYFYCKDDYEELIKKITEIDFEIYSESKIKSSKFREKYFNEYPKFY